MSDIQTILARWGGWAREHSHLDYPHIANGFKGLVAIVVVRQFLQIWRKTRNYKPIWLWEGCQPLSP